MSTTLGYGYKKPQNGDRGTTFWDDLAFDIQRVNDHTHDGLNSSMLTSASITAATATILAASHSSLGDGLYSQTVTMPTGQDYSDYHIEFRNATTGDLIHPTCNKVSDTQYTVIINDNTFNITALYIS